MKSIFLPLLIFFATLHGGCNTVQSVNYDHLLFVTNFNSNTVSILEYDSETRTISPDVQQVATENKPVTIITNNDYVYVGNWMENTIQIFREEKERLQLQHSVSTAPFTKPHYFLISNDKKFLLVAHESEEGVVSVWRIKADGSISIVSSVETGNMSSWLTSLPSKNIIYTTSRKTNEISSLSLNSNGQIYLLNKVSTPANSEPYIIEAHPTEPYIFTLMYSSSQIYVHERNVDGSIKSPEISVFNLPSNAQPRSLTFDATYKKLYVVSSNMQKIIELNYITPKTLSVSRTYSTELNPRHILRLPGDGYLISIEEGVQLFTANGFLSPANGFVKTGRLTHYTTYKKKH